MLEQLHESEIGVDEVGRGCLLGPVVACAVLLPSREDVLKNEHMWKQVKDSKKVSQKKRKELYEFIIGNVPSYGIGMVDEKVIDKINILQATMKAMHLALDACLGKVDDGKYQVMVDGLFFKVYMPRDGIEVNHTCVVKGDSLYLSIAASSILAKYTRDTYVQELEEAHHALRVYGLSKNKGYGTKEHLLALHEHGACEFHRKSFKPISLAPQPQDKMEG